MTVGSDRTGALGRGLASLIPHREAGPGPTEISLDRIIPNRYQPRTRIDAEELEELAASIRAHGVLQPVLVSQTLDGYELIAGERRVRAARLAGLERVPAVIRQLADRDRLELAIVENVQRADLDPLEEANAYRQLAEEFGLSQERIAERVGRARATIANTMRLLDLHPEVQRAIAEREITEGHGRALGGLSPDAQRQLLPTVIAQGLSVRQTEELVRRLREPRATPAGASAQRLDPELERVEEDLRATLGTKVSLVRSRRGGRIVIEYYSDEELGRLYDRLIGRNA